MIPPVKMILVRCDKLKFVLCSLLGTPEIDTVCEACPQGLFSSRMSASEPCVPHRNCSELGLKTLRPGTPTQDTLCENEAKGTVLECSHHHTQCHTGENIQNNGDICQTLLNKAI